MMKMKSLIARLLLAFSVVTFVASYHVTNVALARMVFQDQTGVQGTPGRVRKENGNSGGTTQTNRTQTGSGRNSNGGSSTRGNVNNDNVNNTDQNHDDEELNLEPNRKQLRDRANAALNDAKSAAGDSKDPKIKAKLDELSGKVKTFERSLETAKTTKELDPFNKISDIEGTSKEIVADSNPSSWSDNLTYSNIVSTTSLLLALIALGTLTYSFFGFRSRMDQVEIAQGKIAQSLNKMKQTIGETKTYAESVGASLSRAQDDLGLKIESAKRSSEEAKKMARSVELAPASVEPLRVEQRLEPVDPEPSFPALVSDYLNRIKGSRKKGVEADFRTNTLVPTTDGSAPFMFVEDIDGSGAGVVLPKPRLQRSQEFSSYYKGYYYCNEPSAGEVYVVEPAIVEREGNGWRLRHMGRMEIR
jgi:F0F1-type ATP synthase membrane subunit b/b'